jgi:cytochrome c5
MVPRIAFATIIFLGMAASAAARGPEIYKTHCSLCHDSGATSAPRLGNRAEWAPRLGKGRPALVQSALKGVPDTAMIAKGGAAELPDADIVAAVEFMLSAVGGSPSLVSVPVTEKQTSTVRTQEKVDDSTLITRVAEALRARLAPQADVSRAADGTRVAGIKVESQSGRVTLSGMVGEAKVIRGAEAAAREVPGVAAVVNRLISAELFEHD